MKINDLPNDLDERLWEWAYYFKNRERFNSCGSIESRYKRISDDHAKEGWGDEEAAPSANPARSYRLPRALETHDVIQGLDKPYKWAITYWYCYPGMKRHLMLRLMKKYAGSYLSWWKYLEVLDIGRMRVYALLSK